MSRECEGNMSYWGGEWKVVSLISSLNPANVRVLASWLGLGCFRNSESQGKGSYHIYHWRWRQSLKSLLRCLRLVFTGLVSSEFRAAISPFLNKTRQQGLMASLTFPVYLCDYRAASDGRNFYVICMFLSLFQEPWSPRAGLPSWEAVSWVSCKEWVCLQSERMGQQPDLVNSLII